MVTLSVFLWSLIYAGHSSSTLGRSIGGTCKRKPVHVEIYRSVLSISCLKYFLKICWLSIVVNCISQEYTPWKINSYTCFGIWRGIQIKWQANATLWNTAVMIYILHGFSASLGQWSVPLPALQLALLYGRALCWPEEASRSLEAMAMGGSAGRTEARPTVVRGRSAALPDAICRRCRHRKLQTDVCKYPQLRLFFK
jgi:hypothetical protein